MGGLMVIGAIAYGVMFVGLPGPDDTLAELQRQDRQGNVAVVMFGLGVIAVLIGGVAAAVKMVRR